MDFSFVGWAWHRLHAWIENYRTTAGERLTLRLVAKTSSKDATILLAPTQPSARGEAFANVIEPSAAPIEKPMYWKDAFSESATGANSPRRC